MIIDASVGVKWLVPEADSNRANDLIGEMLLVPSLFYSEVANALWKKARRGEVSLEPLVPQLRKLSLVTESFDDTEHVARALEMGAELDHPIYDCLYLAAAEAFGDVLVTADRKFLRKVANGKYRGLVVDLANRRKGS